MKKRRDTERHGDEQVKRLTQAGVLTALVCGATLVLTLPSPSGGYLNLGDAAVLLGAWLLGPAWGAAAGGIGAALADLLAGYGAYAPATLVIKALMALTAGVLYRLLGRRRWALPVCGGAAEGLMALGYWGYDAFLSGSKAAALAGVPANLAQGLFGLTAASLLALALRKNPYVREKFPEL